MSKAVLSPLMQDLSQEVAPSDPPTVRTPMDDYFLSETALFVKQPPRGAAQPSCHVSVDPPELLFYEPPLSRTLTVTNHTKGKLCLLWTPGDPDSPFSVSPETCELGPLKTTDFRVTYNPRQANTVHASQLECFAIYKVLYVYGIYEVLYLFGIYEVLYLCSTYEALYLQNAVSMRCNISVVYI